MKAVLVWALAAGVVADALPSPAPASSAAGAPLAGFASAYAPGVFEATVRYRLDHDVWRVEPPWDWYYRAEGYAAVADCARVGEMATLVAADGREYEVLIADCAGNDNTPEWMAANRIIVELDARLWAYLVERHGRPLAVELAE